MSLSAIMDFVGAILALPALSVTLLVSVGSYAAVKIVALIRRGK